MTTKVFKCQQHNSQVQTICNYKDCQNRGMCLLCDHNHVFLHTIKQSIPIYYNKFVKRVTASIDNILSSTIEKDKQVQYNNKKIIIHSYFDEALKCIGRLFEEKKKRVLGMLEECSDDVPGILRKYRIDGSYLNAQGDDWKLLMSLYEGNQIQQYYLEKNQGVQRRIEEEMKSIQEMIRGFQERFNVVLKDAIPKYPSMSHINLKQISNILIKNQQKDKNTHFDILPSGKQYKDKVLLQTSAIQYSSILTDGIFLNSLIYTTSYDKTLRVLSKDLILLKEHQFNNTLESLLPISDNQIILSISKQLSLVQITNDQNHQIKELMRLKGHQQKIKSVDNMNKRIVASAGSDCVYIWDLFKDNQSYAIREKISPSVVGFMKDIKRVVVGYSDWNAKIFDVETLKRIRTVQLTGIPLVSMKVNQNIHYLGGFPNVLTMIDSRMSQPVKYQIGEEALTCVKNKDGLLLVGNRQSRVHLCDLREMRPLMEWQAHDGMSSWDKPNGIANLELVGENLYTFGVNDKLIKKWKLL